MFIVSDTAIEVKSDPAGDHRCYPGIDQVAAVGTQRRAARKLFGNIGVRSKQPSADRNKRYKPREMVLPNFCRAGPDCLLVCKQILEIFPSQRIFLLGT